MARSRAAILLIVFGGAITVAAQFGPFRDPTQAPQAKTKEELDLYLEIVAAADPAERIASVKRFVRSHPDSALLGTAYQYEMLAHQEREDWNGMIAAGRKALPLLRDNLRTLQILASALVNIATAEDVLVEAEGYARRLLAALPLFHVPREMVLEEWERMRGELEAKAHEVLGQIAAKRGRWSDAVIEFQLAVDQSPAPQGAQFLRLGVACATAGRRDCALRALARAKELGPDDIARRAEDVIRRQATR